MRNLIGRKGLVRATLLTLVIVIGSVITWVFLTHGRGDSTLLARARAESSDGKDKPISVKSVYPRNDSNFQITVERPADVEAYYRADIESHVAGEVKWIRVAPGSEVDKGQVLVRVLVPDKVALAREKQYIIGQREREYKLMLEKTSAAEEAVKTALANVELKKALLLQAKAQTAYREVQLRNLEALLKSRSIEEIVRDEGVKNLDYARASEVGADADRIKAQQQVEDARANVRVAEAEVERAKQLIEVAKADFDQANAIVDYAEVKAPFHGSVVARHVDPGSFVQNASTGHPTPLLSLERSDVVTVMIRVPDNYAPYIGPATEGILEVDSLPGVKIHGKVTRFAPSLVTAAHDRTMRVEMDLWNEAPEKYDGFFADPKNRAEMKDGPLPLLPSFTGKAGAAARARLIPGMYGKMKLVLKSLGKVELIPSQAIMRQGGRASIFVVKDGSAHRVPVEVQVDDGTLARVLLLGASGEVVGPLPDSLQVIVSNQEELSEGQTVAPVVREGWDRSATQPPH